MSGRPLLDVSRETQGRLETLVDLLKKWSPRINLVSRTTLDHAWTRHIQDSLQLWPLRPQGAETWIDLGSGGGFPGLVICALAAETEMRVTLVESDSRKCAFLATAAREMGVEADIRNQRIETISEGGWDVISARALAPLFQLLAYAERLAGPGATCLFPKGAGASDELTDARRAWHIESRSHPSVTDPHAVILEIEEFSRVRADDP